MLSSVYSVNGVCVCVSFENMAVCTKWKHNFHVVNSQEMTKEVSELAFCVWGFQFCVREVFEKAVYCFDR